MLYLMHIIQGALMMLVVLTLLAVESIFMPDYISKQNPVQSNLSRKRWRLGNSNGELGRIRWHSDG
jgi:hypothetical protein